MVARFKKVTYYSLRYEKDTRNLFERFINRIDPVLYKDDLGILRSWMSKIGDRNGANITLFRPELKAGALPPPIESSSLRLYCMRISDITVILFDGCVKTAQKAQDCPNCRPRFREANAFAAAIDRLIVDREIMIDEQTDELMFDENLTIEL